MGKLHLIFLNHPWEESLLPWGHITGVRKTSSRVIATSRVAHTAFSYGVHITETTEQPFTDMFLIMYIFYFTSWFSCSFYFCDITFFFFTLKARDRRGSRHSPPETLGRIFQIKTTVCNFFFYTVPNDETYYSSSLPDFWVMCLWTVHPYTSQNGQF